MIQMMYFDVYFDKILCKKVIFLYRNNDVIAARLGIFRKIKRFGVFWCIF